MASAPVPSWKWMDDVIILCPGISMISKLIFNYTLKGLSLNTIQKFLFIKNLVVFYAKEWICALGSFMKMNGYYPFIFMNTVISFAVGLIIIMISNYCCNEQDTQSTRIEFTCSYDDKTFVYKILSCEVAWLWYFMFHKSKLL